MIGERAPQFIKVQELTFEPLHLTGLHGRHVARHQVVGTIDLDPMAGEKHSDVVAGSEFAQQLLPFVIEFSAGDIFRLDDIKPEISKGVADG